MSSKDQLLAQTPKTLRQFGIDGVGHDAEAALRIADLQVRRGGGGFQRGDIGVLAIDAAHAVKLGADRAPNTGGRALRDGLQISTGIEDGVPIFINDAARTQLFSRHMFFQTRADDAAGMQGEGAHAVGLAALVEFDGEEDVGRLRLTVGYPFVVCIAILARGTINDGTQDGKCATYMEI